MNGYIIVAKGPTAKRMCKLDYPNTYIVCINQACCLVDKPDFVVMNDIEALDGLTLADIKDVQTFVIPEYPHLNGKSSLSITKKDFVNKLDTLGFVGNVQTYNLYNSPSKKNKSITVSSNCVSTTHTAICYLNLKYNATNFETYGFLKGSGYNEDIEKRDIKYLKCYDDRIRHYEINLAKMESMLHLKIKRF